MKSGKLPTIKNPNPYTPYTMPKPPMDSKRPTVLVLETNATKSDHASKVSENLKATNPEVNIQFQDGSIENWKNSFAFRSTSLENYIFSKITATLQDRTGDFKAIAKDKQKPDVINISQAVSPLSVLEYMLEENPDTLYAVANSEERKSLFDPLNIPDENRMNQNKPNEIRVEAYIDEVMEKRKSEIDKIKADYRKAAKVLKDQGTAIVVASGNDKSDLAKFKKAMPSIQFEKDETKNVLACPEVIVVGASGKNGKSADYSNQGPEVDINTTPAYPDDFGTSFSAPVIAGEIAKIKHENPKMSVDEALAALKQKGRLVKDPDGDFIYVDTIGTNGTLEPKKRKRDRPSALDKKAGQDAEKTMIHEFNQLKNERA
ncbi:MAG: S8 family serine peptidase [Vampirovibrio sp.]